MVLFNFNFLKLTCDAQEVPQASAASDRYGNLKL